MCAKSLDDLDNYLQYDWVGAPWNIQARVSGNGGLSLRKVSSIIKVLQHQNRINKTDPEDVWLTDRLVDLIGADVANGTESLKFSVESQWHDTPMGYHTGGGGKYLGSNVWGQKVRRDHIFQYCPEMKITLDMDHEAFFDKFCHESW